MNGRLAFWTLLFVVVMLVALAVMKAGGSPW